MKCHGRAWAIVTDRLRSYGAALKAIGGSGLQATCRWTDTALLCSAFADRAVVSCRLLVRIDKNLRLIEAADSTGSIAERSFDSSSPSERPTA